MLYINHLIIQLIIFLTNKSHVSSNFICSCSESEFTCGDGSCISLESKCDGVSDCKDQLDEMDCRLVEFPRERQYQENIPPLGGSKKVDVKLALEVMAITEIKESYMKWGCKFLMNLTWTEDRLKWRDLRKNPNLNLISTVLSRQRRELTLNQVRNPN